MVAVALVVPINRPAYTAPCNGAIEHIQGKFKRYLDRHRWKADSRGGVAVLAETAAHDLNHRHRRSLEGQNACHVYFGEQQLRYPKRQRQDVYRWIRDLAIAVSRGCRQRLDYAGRLAGGSQAMAAEKQDDQNPEGRESVTRFFFEFVS